MASSVTAVTPANDATALDTNPDVLPWALIDVTAITGRTGEPFRERKPVTLGQPAGQPNVLPRAIGVTLTDSLLCQPRETLDALSGDLCTHY